ncbi:MAG: ABC transporter substrate-binding protein [Candidatus Omnitrophota bacterium]
MITLRGCIVVLVVFLIAEISYAEVGISDNEVIVGQSAAVTGPAEALGKAMKFGMEVYFRYINDLGGINGRKVRLISYDDGYEPLRCVDQTRKLISDGVFALIGYVGTPTSNAAVPIAEEEKIPYIGPFTGAEFLRNPVKHYVINIRGSYYDETEELAKYLVDNLGIKRIACFYQDDSYGRAGLEGTEKALNKRGMILVSQGTYTRNTLAVKGGLMQVKRGAPEAVIMIGAYAPCAEFIKLAKKIGMENVAFCNVSFVGSEALSIELADAGEGVIISQVVPFPWDSSNPLIKEYQALLEKYASPNAAGFVSLEGFIVAKFFVEAIKACGREITREGLISTMEKKKVFDLGGVVLSFSQDDHQGMDDIHLTAISKGGFENIRTNK